MPDRLQAFLQICEARRNITKLLLTESIQSLDGCRAAVECGLSSEVKSLGSFGEGLIELLRRYLPLLEQLGPRLFLLAGVGLFFVADFLGFGIVQPAVSRLVEGGILERQ